MNQNWYVYMLRCGDGTFYTGITTDLERRLAEHNASKKGAKYTQMRRPVVIHYIENQPTRSAAAIREYELKQLSRAAKQNLKN